MPVTDAEMVALQYSRLTQLQRLFFKYHPSLRELALSNCGTLQKRTVLKPALQGLDLAELQKLVIKQLRWAKTFPPPCALFLSSCRPYLCGSRKDSLVPGQHCEMKLSQYQVSPAQYELSFCLRLQMQMMLANSSTCCPR